MVLPMPVDAAHPHRDASQNNGHVTDQNMTMAASEARAAVSPYVRGIVSRPRAMSPSMSGRSWAWTVVMMTAPVTRIQAKPRGSSSPPESVARAPQLKHMRPPALRAFRIHMPLLLPSRSLYIQIKTIKVMLAL